MRKQVLITVLRDGGAKTSFARGTEPLPLSLHSAFPGMSLPSRAPPEEKDRLGGYPRISIGCEKIGGKGRIFAPFIV